MQHGRLERVQRPAYMDAGYFFSPYVPTTSTPVVLNPNVVTIGPNDLSSPAEEWPVPRRKQVHRSIEEPWEVTKFEG